MLPSPLEAAEQVHVIGDGDLGFTSGLSFLDAERGIDVLVRPPANVTPTLGRPWARARRYSARAAATRVAAIAMSVLWASAVSTMALRAGSLKLSHQSAVTSSELAGPPL
jgi:hypothetical protein